MSALEALEHQIDPLLLFFDFVRIVDPVKQVVLYQKKRNGKLEQLNERCYQVWKCDKGCENCVSMQALQMKQSFEKLEYVGETVFLVVSSTHPELIPGLVMEALRDVTNSPILASVQHRTRQAIQVEIDQLNHQIMTDRLTGLYTRTYLETHFPALLANHQTTGQAITFCFCDLDDFKGVNDRYGHLVGDQLLSRFGQVLKMMLLHEKIWLSRIGGDEFVMVIEAANQQTVDHAIATLHYLVKRILIPLGKCSIQQIQVSIGVTNLQATDTLETVMLRADKAMYAAKEK